MENIIKEDSKIHILDNKYNIIQKIAKGGFGKTFLVEKIETGEKYVAKIPIKENNEDFEEEIKIFKYLKNKNIDNSFIINFYNDGIGPKQKNK